MILATLAAILVGCGLQPTSVAESWRQKSAAKLPKAVEGLKRQGVLTVGIRKAAAAPFVTLLEPTAQGLDADVASAIGDQMGLSVEFLPIDDVQEALAGECDVVMGAPRSKSKSYALVGNYADSALSLFHRGDAGVVDVKQINGTRIALQDGSSAQMALRITALEVTEVPARSLNDAFAALDAGEADFVCCQAASGGYLTLGHAGYSFAGAMSDLSAHGVAVGKNNASLKTAVSEAFDALEGNGVLASIRQSWLGELPVLGKEHKIRNVPMRETSGDSLESVVAEDEVLGNARDGSSAGANAVGFAGERNSEATYAPAVSSTSSGTSDEGEDQTAAYATGRQAYDAAAYDGSTYDGSAYDDAAYDPSYGNSSDDGSYAGETYDATAYGAAEATDASGATSVTSVTGAPADVAATAPVESAAAYEDPAATAGGAGASSMVDEGGSYGADAATYSDAATYTESFEE